MYEPTIGLEIHAELDTQTKMFCESKNDPNETKPNVNICPVCMAHPGVLPTINKEAVLHVLRVGVAVNGELADYSEFDRKNYFYPDIPKAYQLSQYEFPLVSKGSLHGVALTRIHLEEDTARSSHTSDAESSLVDFNRAGVPLMELVTEPDIHTAQEAAGFARELQLLLRTLGASHANMEKGEMRVEANISVARQGAPLGTKVEVKNLNSFKSVERAIEFEVKRHIGLLEKGEKIVQETRGWDENKGVTFSQRLKEEAADYRYFPDPDLPKLKLTEIPEFAIAALQKSLPELPTEKRERLKEQYDLGEKEVELYVSDVQLTNFFEKVVQALIEKSSDGKKVTRLASNYITNNLVALRELVDGHVADHMTPAVFADIVHLAHEGKVSSNGAVELIRLFAVEGPNGSPEEVAQKQGLLQESGEDVLAELVTRILNENTAVVQEYKEGKEQALQYLIGQGMKLSQGKANPGKLKELIKGELG